MSGTPVLRVGMDIMQGAVITQIKGILNGTTNYILTQMENGISYNEALLKSQNLGYAEANPDGDVKGHDAAGKIVILANLLMDVPLRMQDVPCTGITHITEKDINIASKDKKRWKLVNVLKKQIIAVRQGSNQNYCHTITLYTQLVVLPMLLHTLQNYWEMSH